jgi:hypothetical protein
MPVWSSTTVTATSERSPGLGQAVSGALDSINQYSPVVIINGLAAILFMIGYVLFGLAMIRTGTLPRWSQQRDIMEQAKVAARGAVGRAAAVAERAGSQDPSVRDVEYVRMFAKVAQVQFQAVLDGLNEHVNRLGELSGIAQAAKSG